VQADAQEASGADADKAAPVRPRAAGRARPFPLGRTARIAVFASGRGSNLASLLAAFPPHAAATDGRLGSITLVISNRSDAPALERARAAGVSAHHVRWDALHGKAAFEREATTLLTEADIDLVCLAGFMRLLSPDFTERYAGRLLNIHPSLLPDFRGLHAQRQALEAGVDEAGCTVHFVDAGVDTGAPILQRKVPVLRGDTEESLTARILEAEHEAYPEAVRMVLKGEA